MLNANQTMEALYLLIHPIYTNIDYVDYQPAIDAHNEKRDAVLEQFREYLEHTYAFHLITKANVAPIWEQAWSRKEGEGCLLVESYYKELITLIDKVLG